MWNQDWYTEADYDADELDRFSPGFPGKSSADWGWVQHIQASLKSESSSQQAGRAAVVLDTGAASRGSGNAGTNKEKIARQWFVDNDLIESVLYLPENLFYNTPAPGIVLFLNKGKPEFRQRRVLLCKRQPDFRKGRPKELHIARGNRPYRQGSDPVEARRKTEPHRRLCRIEEKRLQHLT